ncbi:MAG: cytochrome C biogenesis protein [Candidatus Omnitrophica bacterium CG11_big_fil_rev_8_21_14_0_20_45_26]|uniref:Cytochrome C biogenesis protein n=1 Tax=Candidatus Abzuiibacterium crystallinum TaxID=1974748 RepID=A0A2H0LRM5_9BACT|nr:MAG: cytochrome C biogenesis protein [Candidatus Omnitrophica bacterium CG11_big_fil_rev_8_21_14_0_20_45_26]PIW64589.1 MAG: cytochrome C biogenesis protein [Candidatus Omnitrophica bacterium CG12_big_fil_rev_8_21_14_0_65_45_16]
MKKMFWKPSILILLAGCWFAAATLHIPFAAADDARSVSVILDKIPVQDSGRIKPFESFARENVLQVTGKSSYEHLPPSLLVWLWIANPDEWSNTPLLKISYPVLQERFSSDLVKHRLAPGLVLADLDFGKEVRSIQEKNNREEKLTKLEQEKLSLYHRARLFQAISHGQFPGFMPHPDDPTLGWLPLEIFGMDNAQSFIGNLYPVDYFDSAKNAFFYMLGRLREGNMALALSSTEAFAKELKSLLASRDIVLDQSKINLELQYLQLKPFRLASLFYFLGALAFFFGPREKKKWASAAFTFFVTGFLLHTYGFALRVMIAGRPPVSNMYESVIWVAWGVVLFAGILWLVYRSPAIPAIASMVAALTLLIGESLPAVLDPSIKPLVPVLRSNYWLTIHVLTITLGYGAFLLNWGIAHALMYQMSFGKKQKKSAEPLTEFLFRTLQIGIIFLSAGTILGGVWAAESWGRFWGWDPKETWALIAILAYLAVLHARSAGWLDTFGVAFYSALCFLTVIMAWYGVNFVLAAGLHSYGFGGGGFPYVSIVIAIDVLVINYFAWRFKNT